MAILDSRDSVAWTVENRVPGHWAGLVVFFVHTRTKLLSVSAGGATAADPVQGKTFVLRWSPSDDERTELRVEYLGDPPVLRRIVWLAAGGSRLALQRPLQGVHDPLTFGDVWPAGEAEHRAREEDESLEEQFERRERQILEEYDEAAERARTRRDRRLFFYHLDKETMVEALPKGKLKDSIVALKDRVSTRVEERARALYEGNACYQPECVEDRKVEEAARRVSRHLLGLFKTFVSAPECHWIDRGRSPDFWRDRFRRLELAKTFDEFASGRLLVFQSHGAPNGTNFFFFAEAALLFLDLRVRDDFWINTIETFVRSSEVFLHTYWGGGCRRRSDYGWSNNDDGRFDYPRDLRDLDRSYSERSLEDLKRTFQATLTFALRDSFLEACPHG